LLPAALAAPILALRRRQWPAALAFSLPLAFFLEFQFLMLDHRDNRYILPGIALAAVACAWLCERLGRWSPMARMVLLAAIPIEAAMQVRFDHFTLENLVLASLALGFLGLWTAGRRTLFPGLWRGRHSWTFAALVLGAALPLGWVVERYQEAKLARVPAPLALETLAAPAGARVHYTGFNQPYLFFGSRLQNDVEIVPRAGGLARQYYRWGSPISLPPGPITYRRWGRNLDHRGIRYVVVVITPDAEPERTWMLERPGRFKRVYQDSRTEIWRVLSEWKKPRGRGGPLSPTPSGCTPSP
jgi:hypothetical protein